MILVGTMKRHGACLFLVIDVRRKMMCHTPPKDYKGDPAKDASPQVIKTGSFAEGILLCLVYYIGGFAVGFLVLKLAGFL